MPGNIFREAKQLLESKNGRDMSEEERELVNIALIPLLLLPEYNDVPIARGLEDLAQILEEAQYLILLCV